jgi:hypothetical protein
MRLSAASESIGTESRPSAIKLNRAKDKYVIAILFIESF